MQPDVRVYLHDMKRACGLIESFVKGKTVCEYAADVMLRSAVERQFEIVGEALNQMVRRFPMYQSSISEAASIVAFRNRLIHEYRTVSNSVVWAVLNEKMPVLKREVEALLEQIGDEV